MTHFKVWLQVERCADDNDVYEDSEGPIALGDFDTEAEAIRFFKALATLFPEFNEDHAYPLPEVAP